MKRDLRWYDAITINIYYLGLTAISQSMVSLLLPLFVQDFVGASRQGTYIGLIRFWGLLTALLSQAVMGLLSDHSTFSWGKRKPFILAGGLLNMFTLCAIGFSSSDDRYARLLAPICPVHILQFGANTSQGGTAMPDPGSGAKGQTRDDGWGQGSIGGACSSDYGNFIRRALLSRWETSGVHSLP